MSFFRNFVAKLFKKYSLSRLTKNPEKTQLTLARIYAFAAWNLLGITIFYFCGFRRGGGNQRVYYEVLENGELVKLSPVQQYVMNTNPKNVRLYTFEGMKFKPMPDPRDLITISDPKLD
ncbi:uncharacterized protein LOC143195409 [Rhynchophorus ferrugineus]|uniref:uncharacterized protein LOC143195409 n=1 Tax=Rhynchophorus ferrugineus TaxID=354439 RepID=UPI003FCE81C9